MGLDLALGGLVLLAGLRGWFKGFILQAIHLGGLVGCVYLADPVRNLAKPHVVSYLGGIQPNLVDRLLWWAGAVVAYFVTVGMATLLVKLSRRRAIGEPEPYYNDRFAGFLFGLIKGTAIAAALAAGVQAHALDRLKGIPWAGQQAEGSRVLDWNAKYRPVAKVWLSRPVQHFVNEIRSKGIQAPAGDAAPTDPVAAVNRPPHLTLPAASGGMSNDRDANAWRLVESIQAVFKKFLEPQ